MRKLIGLSAFIASTGLSLFYSNCAKTDNSALFSQRNSSSVSQAPKDCVASRSESDLVCEVNGVAGVLVKFNVNAVGPIGVRESDSTKFNPVGYSIDRSKYTRLDVDYVCGEDSTWSFSPPVSKPAYCAFTTVGYRPPQIIINKGDFRVVNTPIEINGYRMLLQPDGNLVIYNDAGTAVWASNSTKACVNNTQCIWYFQPDGNFVTYRDANQPTWNSKTVDGNDPSKVGAKLLFKGTAPYLQIFNSSNVVIWDSSMSGVLL